MEQRKTFTSKSIDDTNQIAFDFVENLLKTCEDCGKHAVIIALEGDLGSGKTTFVKAVAAAFGVEITVTSPTFVLEKVYEIEEIQGLKHLVHIDAYRLRSGTELLSLGWEKLIRDPQNIIFLEWPERVAEILPIRTKKIHFKFVDEWTRVITIK